MPMHMPKFVTYDTVTNCIYDYQVYENIQVVNVNMVYISDIS